MSATARYACRIGLPPATCGRCSNLRQSVARSQRAFEAASAARDGGGAGTATRITLPRRYERLNPSVYLEEADWFSYLSRRGFISDQDAQVKERGVVQNNSCPEGCVLVPEIYDDDANTQVHVLSAALTHPMTIAHGIAQIVDHVGSKARARELLVSPMTSLDENSTTESVAISVLGARAEAMVPGWAWLELALACCTLLDTGHVHLVFCGPALTSDNNNASAAADIVVNSGSSSSSKSVSPSEPLVPVRHVPPLSHQGPNGEQLTVSMQHFHGFYQDIAHRMVGAADTTTPSQLAADTLPQCLADTISLHCMLNPGIAHPQWSKGWTGALQTLASGAAADIAPSSASTSCGPFDGSRSSRRGSTTSACAAAARPKTPVLMTSYDFKDNAADRARACQFFGMPLHDDDAPDDRTAGGGGGGGRGGADDRTSAAARVNPFRSYKFDALWETRDAASQRAQAHAKAAAGAGGYDLRHVQSNWTTRVYVPDRPVDV